MEIDTTEEHLRITTDLQLPSNIKFCLICLKTKSDCKLYASYTYNLNLEFEQLTGITLPAAGLFRPKFCAVCARRLMNITKFREQSLRAYEMLLDLIEKDKPLTTHTIESINIDHKHSDGLQMKIFPPNYFNMCIIHGKPELHEVKHLPKHKPIKIEADLKPGTHILKPVNKQVKVECDDRTNESNEDEYEIEELEDFMTDVEYLEDFDDDFDLPNEEILNKNNANKNEVINVDCDSTSLQSDSEVLYDNSDADNDDDELDERNEATDQNNETHDDSENKDNSLNQQFLIQYTVKELTHQEQLADIQKRQFKEAFKKAPYRCMRCFKSAWNEKSYRAHMELHTDKYGTFVCPVCGIHRDRQCAVNAHVRFTHKTRYSCNSCDLVTNHKQVAQSHYNAHRGVIYRCPYCQEKFITRTSYQAHMRTKHPSDIACALCGNCFLTRAGLVMHVKKKHFGESSTQQLTGPWCAACDMRFATTAAYDHHLKSSTQHASRSDQKPKPPRKVADGRGGKKHQYGNKPRMLTCEQCGMDIRGFQAYVRHFKSQHPGVRRAQHQQSRAPVLCDLCGGSFSDRYSLRTHLLLKHHGEKKYECDVCGMKYHLKSGIARHLLIHRNDVPVYQCPVCDKQFQLHANCMKHLWTHEEKKPFPCSQCEKTFPYPSHLRTHVEHAHQRKPYPRKGGGPKQRPSRPRGAKDLAAIVRPEGCTRV